MTPSTSSREHRSRVTSPGTGAAIPRPHRPLPRRGRTFQSSRSGTAFVGGICSPARAGGVNEVSGVRAPMRAGWEWGGPSGDSPVPPVQYGNVAAMAVTLAQTLGQNVGMMWNKHRTAAGTCHPHGSGMGTLWGHCGDTKPAGGQPAPPARLLSSQGTAGVRTRGWAASWRTQGGCPLRVALPSFPTCLVSPVGTSLRLLPRFG